MKLFLNDIIWSHLQSFMLKYMFYCTCVKTEHHLHCVTKMKLFIRNGCILILWVHWRPAMGSSGCRTPRASHSVCGYRFRLLGDGFKIKSVTPYCGQSERGSQPWGGGKFSASPWEGKGGGGERSVQFFPFLPGGRGRSPVRWSWRWGAGFVPYPEGLVRPRKEGGALGVESVAGRKKKKGKENYVWKKL